MGQAFHLGLGVTEKTEGSNPFGVARANNV